MKKFILFFLGIIVLALNADAQLVRSRTFGEKEKTGFDRISVGYDAMYLDHSFSTLNGVNFQYIHGFRVAKFPLFIEIGVDVSYNTMKYLSYESYDYNYMYANTENDRLNSLSVRLPLNLSYKFQFGEKFSIQPFTGFNFKVNPLLDNYDYSKHEYLRSGIRKHYYENLENKMFQWGWQIGLGLNITKLYLGFQYNLDFLPRADFQSESYTYNNIDYEKHNYKYDSYSLKSSRILVSVGVTF